MHYKNLIILFFCQLVSVSGSIIFATIGGIVGSNLASDPALATLPITLMIIGTALSTVPATMVMKRTSRRFGFCLAAFIAFCAMLLAAYALQSSSYVLFCVATGSFGFNMAFAQQYRFAAAESVPLEKAGMAISIVLMGAIGAAILGPSLLIHSKNWIVATPYVGSLLVLAGFFLLSILLLLGLQERQINQDSETNLSQRDLGEIIRNPVYKVAVLGGIRRYSWLWSDDFDYDSNTSKHAYNRWLPHVRNCVCNSQSRISYVCPFLIFCIPNKQTGRAKNDADRIISDDNDDRYWFARS